MVRLFSTQFPLDEKIDLEKVLELGRTWIAGNKYSRLNRDEILLLEKTGDFTQSGGERLEFGRSKTSDYEVAGFRYRNPDQRGGVYVADCVFLCEGDSRIASVNVDYETLKPGVKIPDAKKPNIIRLLLKHVGGGLDGDILVGDKPRHLREGDESFVSDILLGKTSGVMPIIYLSRDDYNLLGINEPEKLAEKLSGIAHVLIEPSRRFSFELKKCSNGYNVYGGAVGLFWPEGFGRLYWKTDNPELKRSNAHDMISQTIVDGLKTRVLRRELTWENIHSLHNLELIKKIREGQEQKSQQSDGLVKLYEEELGNKEVQIGESEKRIRFLENELRKASANSGENEGGIINVPQITQIYEDELRGIVLESLKTAVRNTPDRTRKRSLLEAVVASNAPSNKRKEISEKIKRLFRDYRGLSGQLRGELERMGFEIVKEGGHYKMYLAGQVGGICVTFPATPGDVMAGRAMTTTILNTFF